MTTTIGTGAARAVHPAALPYLNAHYAMEATAHAQLVQRLLALAPDADLKAYWDDEDEDRPAARAPKKPYQVTSGVAVVPLVGLLQKTDSWLTRWYPEAATCTPRFVQALQQALGDPEVTAVVIRIDSPGGLVDGTFEAAEAVYQARQAAKKPLVAISCGLCCSAAYWIGSQAGELYAGETDWVGSIGTRLSLLDSTQYYAELGLTRIEVTSGTYKAAGADGQPVTEEVQAYFQDLVDRMQERFTAGVARGRKLGIDAVRKVAAEARVYIGRDAQAAGLVDGIDTLSGVIKRLQKSGGTAGARAQTGKETRTMTEDQEQPGAGAEQNPAVAPPTPAAPPAAAPTAAAVSAADFDRVQNELRAANERMTRLEAQNAVLQAAREQNELVETLGALALGAEGRLRLTPASRTALAAALAQVPTEARAAVVAAVQGLQLFEPAARGFTPTPAAGPSGTLSETERRIVAGMAKDLAVSVEAATEKYLAVRAERLGQTPA